jgi:hypothetical protein
MQEAVAGHLARLESWFSCGGTSRLELSDPNAWFHDYSMRCAGRSKIISAGGLILPSGFHIEALAGGWKTLRTSGNLPRYSRLAKWTPIVRLKRMRERLRAERESSMDACL